MGVCIVHNLFVSYIRAAKEGLSAWSTVLFSLAVVCANSECSWKEAHRISRRLGEMYRLQELFEQSGWLFNSTSDLGLSFYLALALEAQGWPSG